MEKTIRLSGIGGQGIQLTAKVLALAAIEEDRYSMLNGFYGSEMRGGVSASTVVIGDGPLKSLPVATRIDGGVVLHHHFWDQSVDRLAPGALVAVDAQSADKLPPMSGQQVVVIPATQAAIGIGNPMVMGFVLLSAFNTLAGLVRTDSLVAAMRQVVPSHRKQHVEFNERAILAGAELARAQMAADPAPRAAMMEASQ